LKDVVNDLTLALLVALEKIAKQNIYTPKKKKKSAKSFHTTIIFG